MSSQSPDDSPDLNKLDLFIKFMKMTDAEDNISLVAIRKANQLLKAEGWDWDKLLRGKVRIISNPFANGGPAHTPMTATPARRATPQPAPAPRQATPAANPWPSGGRPAPKPYTPKPQPVVAPPGPLHFRKASNDKWCIASHIGLSPGTGPVLIHKKDGSTTSEFVGAFIEKTPAGYHLYEIAHANKWKAKHAGNYTPTIDDLI